jgi:hypothetical protein
VLIDRLHLSPTAFVTHMLLPGLLAAALCAGAVALSERAALAASYRLPPRKRTPLSRAERHAAISLAGAAAAAWTTPFAGIAPWWPFTTVVVLALAVRRPRPSLVFPWRIATQLSALLIVIGSLGLTPPTMPPGLPGLLAVAGAVGVTAALINNLPASVWATSLLAGRSGYAASIGLAIGSLATPQGSVATLIASDLAGEAAPPIPARRFALIASTALTAATLLLWAGL